MFRNCNFFCIVSQHEFVSDTGGTLAKLLVTVSVWLSCASPNLSPMMVTNIWICQINTEFWQTKLSDL